MALYNIEQLKVKVLDIRQYEIVDRTTVGVAYWNDSLLSEPEDFIIESLIIKGHLTEKATEENLEIMYTIESNGHARARVRDRETLYPLFDIVRQVKVG